MPAPSSVPLAGGDLLAGRFLIIRLLGHGAMGDVYEAEDRELGERVALKTVRSGVESPEGSLERFRREIQLARKVTHPNVCRIFDVFRHGWEDAPGRGGEVIFFTMELLAGETLERRLRGGGRMRPAEALPIVRQVADALTAAHRAGVIHRDFKPANVMLAPTHGEPRAVVTDFGLARAYGAGEALTVHGDVLGTPSYMAPEQVTGGEISAATDVYALGAVIYEMVTGGPPFVGENAFSTALKRLQEAPPPPRLSAPDLDPAWEAAILRCLEREPADRFQAARDVAAVLAGEEPAPPPPRRRRRSQRRALAAAAAVLLAAALAFAAVSWLRAPPAAGARTSGLPFVSLFRSPDALYAEGVTLLGNLDAARAQERFEKALAARPDDWLARSGLAVALGELGHEDRAGVEAKRALDHAAALPREQRLAVTARYWQVAAGWDKAAASYEELHRLVPGNIEYGLGLVQALARGGRGGEALQVAHRLEGQPAPAAPDVAAAARIALAEAEADGWLSDFAREAQAARRAQELAARQGQDLVAARALTLLGNALASEDDRRGALAAFKQAEAVYAGTGDQRSLARILMSTARVHYLQGELERARAEINEAAEILAEVGDLRLRSLALDGLAAIEIEQGHHAAAQSRYEAASEAYRRLGDQPHEALALGNLGLSLRLQGKLADARRRYEQALALSARLQDRSAQAKQLYNLADVSLDELNLPAAAEYLARSSRLASEIDDQTVILQALLLAGDLAAARGELAAAGARYREAVTKSRGQGNERGAAAGQLALAMLELEKGHPSQAQAYARNALAQFHASHAPDDEAEAQAALAQALDAQRATAEARSLIEQAERLSAKSLNPEVRTCVALARARLAAAPRPEEARRILEAGLAEARGAGLGRRALELRLAMAEVDAAAGRGDRQRAVERLAALESEARGLGFLRIAERAASLLSRVSPGRS